MNNRLNFYLDQILNAAFVIKEEFLKNKKREQSIKIVHDSKIIDFLEDKNQNDDITAFCFDEKELNKMPKEYRKDFKTGKVKAHVRCRCNGTYEIRCQINKQKISASAKTLAEAKQKFIDRLKLATCAPQPCKPENIKLVDYMQQWLDVVKKPYIKQTTFKSYVQTFRADVVPNFGNYCLYQIKAFDVQTVLNDYVAKNKLRTAKKIYQLLSALFDYAVADAVLERSPMAKVQLLAYEQEHGSALTRQEERCLVTALRTNPTDHFLQAFVFLVYTGLRRAELASVKLADGWVTALTAKQRIGKKDKWRNIPVSPMLKKVLPLINVERIKRLNLDEMTRNFKKFCPTHHLHDLRHTFITRCQECKIQRELVSVWAGHTSADKTITSTVYTHLEQYSENQLNEMQKLDYDLKF